MDIGSLFFLLGVLVFVAIFISRPFFEHKATSVSLEEHHYSALLAERDRILTALRELEFDHELGKIPEAAYPFQRAGLMKRGADILRQIDALTGQSAPAIDLDAQIEAAVAARRAAEQPQPATPAAPDDDLETLIASRRRARKENGQPKTGGFCPQCGGAVQSTDRFCPKCGTSLS